MTAFTTTTTTTKRPRLDRMTVVAAARDMLDEQGVAAFSMARLGERLGVTAMALYRHVEDRADLETAVVELVLRELASSQEHVEEWESGVAAWMHSVRRCWVAHPWIGGLLGTRTDVSAPWLVAMERLAAVLAPARLPATVLAQELVLISRGTIGVLWQEVNAPLPQSGVTARSFAHLPVTARRRWDSLMKVLRTYGNDELFDDHVAATLERLRARSS
ncbi:MAG: TetR family transcriptional regulator [Actinobacteria bacterium]|nr:TetR family transcriptional regulator [Actinomycetota bacterium]